MRKKRILFCHTGLSTFVQSDIEILKSDFDIILYHYRIKDSAFGKLNNLIHSFFFALWNVPKVDVVYSFFAGFHCFFPVVLSKLFHKKSVITVGGYDAMSIPSIKYGVFYKKNFLQYCVKQEYKWVDKICPVDESLIQSVNKYADPDGKGYKNGILNFVNISTNKITVIPTGYSHHTFYRKADEIKNQAVLSVGFVGDNQNFRRKGFDLIVEVARIMPEIPFTIAGLTKDFKHKLEKTVPSNITLLEFKNQEDLRKLYSTHKVYLQLSLAEGLPNTLCEAMLCECIPIGSNVNGIPKAIGDTGLILEKKVENRLKELIYKALTADESKGQLARKRMIELFPISKRRDSLLEIINGFGLNFC